MSADAWADHYALHDTDAWRETVAYFRRLGIPPQRFKDITAVEITPDGATVRLKPRGDLPTPPLPSIAVVARQYEEWFISFRYPPSNEEMS